MKSLPLIAENFKPSFELQTMLLIICLFMTGVSWGCECFDNWTEECQAQFDQSIDDECNLDNWKCCELDGSKCDYK